jgi:hypothetical protein
MPVRPVVEPRVERHRSLEGVEPAHDLGEEPERRGEELAPEPAGLRLGGCDLRLVRKPARPGAGDDEAVAFEHRLPRRQLALGGDGRRRLGEPDELGVRVREARAGTPPLVHERMEIALRMSLRPQAPCRRDEIELRVPELRDRPDVARAVDDHLLALERRVEVRDDPYRPGLRTLRQA